MYYTKPYQYDSYACSFGIRLNEISQISSSSAPTLPLTPRIAISVAFSRANLSLHRMCFITWLYSSFI